MPDLITWAADLTWAEIPEPVRAAARLRLLDGLGCLIAGVRRAEAPAAVQVARGLGGPPEATLFGHAGTGSTPVAERHEPGNAEAPRDPIKIGAAAAAFGNAVAMHALDFDDTHATGLVHATTVTAPVALALAEQTGASGEDLLAAYTAGLEVVCRLGAAAPHAFHARGVHATSACGTIAAAVVAGRLLGLDAATTAHAAGIAASGSSGLLEFLHTGGSTKQLHPGFAAHAGIVAARLAAAGATGPAGFLDGANGLFAALAGRAPDHETLHGGLGQRWEAERITVKPYAACRLSHAVLDAAALLRRDVDVSRITAVVIRLHPDALPIVGGAALPSTPYAAKFSAAWCVAAMLLDGALPVEVFDDPHRADIVALAKRVAIEPLRQDVPTAAADAPGRIRAQLAHGGVREVGVPRCGGGADDPGLDELLVAKARANLGERADAVLAALAALPTAPDVKELVTCLA
ncbi:MmgE/PrpD family protein [Catellatospora vulcania]|uniref:MmgE/PrpD family protein n=1 Tax=Catellatospora vulcania TaxID=1460450 RepID=UPI0012D4B86F|nr:MmgE/PrpD family protein [Catellatospora vulcania]